MTKFIKNNLIFLLPILSGVLLILAYPPYDLEFLIWLALIPLFWFIGLKSVTVKRALIGGTITGVIFFGKLFSWLFATYPFEWLGISSGMKTALVFAFLIVLYIIQTVFLGLFFGVFAWCLKLLKLNFNRLSKFNFLITIPALWVVLEYLRAWGLGILWLGKESLLGPHWTLGNLSYALHNKLALIQIADIVGIYGISFLIVFINTILFLILKKCGKLCVRLSLTHKQVIILFIIFAVVVTIWNGYGIYKLNTDMKDVGGSTSHIKARRVALLQTNFLSRSDLNPYQKKEVFKVLLDLFRLPENSREKPDIVIAPEGLGIVSLIGDREIAKYLLKDFWQPGQIYLENEKIIDENEDVKSRLFYYDLEQEKPISFHDKVLLVPNGDFLSYLTKFFLNIYTFDMGYGERFYKRGEKIEPARLRQGFGGQTSEEMAIGGTICSSIVSPNIQRQMTKKGAEVLIVVSSDAPFHGSKSLLTQNLAMSKLRAIENRRYFAQATNMGYSFLLNPKGEIVAKTSELGNEILFADISLLNKKTVYVRFGDWLVILSTAAVLLTLILWYNRRSSL